jgi:hypothetical protein
MKVFAGVFLLVLVTGLISMFAATKLTIEHFNDQIVLIGVVCKTDEPEIELSGYYKELSIGRLSIWCSNIAQRTAEEKFKEQYDNDRYNWSSWNIDRHKVQKL